MPSAARTRLDTIIKETKATGAYEASVNLSPENRIWSEVGIVVDGTARGATSCSGEGEVSAQEPADYVSVIFQPKPMTDFDVEGLVAQLIEAQKANARPGKAITATASVEPGGVIASLLTCSSDQTPLKDTTYLDGEKFALPLGASKPEDFDRALEGGEEDAALDSAQLDHHRRQRPRRFEDDRAPIANARTDALLGNNDLDRRFIAGFR